MKKISLLVLVLGLVAVVSYMTLRTSDESGHVAQGETNKEVISEETHSESAGEAAAPTSAEEAEDASSNISLSSAEGGESERSTSDTVEESSEDSLGSFLARSGDNNTLSTDQLGEFSVIELRRRITNLDYDGNKDNLAFETEYKLERKLNDVPGTMSDTVRCSNSMCGLMFSGQDKTSIMSALDQLSKDEEIGSLSDGGFLRHVEENGIHYGMLVLVFDNDRPLLIN